MNKEKCIFVSDLHGHLNRYEKLFAHIQKCRPEAVFWGGDLLPSAYLAQGSGGDYDNFIADYLAPNLQNLQNGMAGNYPEMFVILGNDDAVSAEAQMLQLENDGLIHYAHLKKHFFGKFEIHGYAIIPPTPFLYKDWEKYDVSRFVDPGCVSPEDGVRQRPVDPAEIRYGHILEDLQKLGEGENFENSIFLFHSPPYQTELDRAALDNKFIDHAPLDVHIGSIAIRRFIEDRQPLITLHGHVHESTRLTGRWKTRIGGTHCFNAAHDGPELSIVEFDPLDPASARRILL